VEGFLVSTRWAEKVDRGSNYAYTIQGAESGGTGGVPGVHQVG
jgi:hypothetical protein